MKHLLKRTWLSLIWLYVMQVSLNYYFVYVCISDPEEFAVGGASATEGLINVVCREIKY